MAEEEIGKINHYFDHVKAAAIELTGSLKVGDTIHVKGHTTDLTEAIKSIEIEHNSIPEANKGDNIGINVKDRVRPHDVVYKIVN